MADDRAAFVDPFAQGSSRPAFVDPFEKKTDGALNWSDVPLEALKNAPSSVYGVGKGLLDAATTAASYANPITGPSKIIGAAKSLYDDPSLIRKLPAAVWQDLVDHYGSVEALKQTMAHDPARVALDAASLAGGAFGVAGKAGEVAGAIGDIGRAADVSKPFYEGLPRAPPPASPPPLPPPELSPVDAALGRLKEAGTPIAVPRAVTSESPIIQAGGQALSKAPIVGAKLREAVEAVPAQVGTGLETIARQYSPELPQNIVGGGIEQSLRGAAEGEAAQAQAAAEADHAARVRAWEKENQAREQAIVDRQAQATSAAQHAFGDTAPLEMAQDTINDVQAAHRQARARKDQLYGDVNNLDARVSTNVFQDLHDRAVKALTDEGVSIDDPGSNASTMLRELERLSGKPGEVPANVPPRMMQALQREYGQNIPAGVFEQMGFPGGTDPVPPDFRMLGAHAPAPGADAVAVQGLEHLSKRIGRMGMQADTPEDRFSSRIVKAAFDDWRNDAMGNLTADSEPGAGAVIDAARAAHRDLMERFGYNYRRLPEGEPRRAAKLLNQIVTGGTGPEALRDNLIGAKPGNRPVSAPLYEAISNAVPNAGEFRNRVRGAYWNAMTEGSPAAVARNVEGLTPTRMGSHLFEPHEHNLMRGYAQLSQDTPLRLKEAARIARENEPKLIKPDVGKSGQTAKALLGTNRSDEQVFTALDKKLRTGGDIKNAARAWGRMSDVNRNEFRGAWLRNMGGGGEDFNLNKFVKNWEDYSDQGKAIMLGREHRQALQDFYTVAKQYADTVRKYGNPSGTAQVQAWHRLAATAGKYAAEAAAGTLSFGLGGLPGVLVAGLGARKLASFLATPSGAQQIGRWSRLARAYTRAPNARTLNLLQTATRALDASQGPAAQ